MTEPTAAAEGTADTGEESAGAPLERVYRTRSPLIALATIATYAAVPLGAAFGSATEFLVSVLLSQVADLFVLTEPYVRAGLARGGLGIATRTLIRELSAVALVLGARDPRSVTARAEALLLLGFVGMRLLYLLLLVPIRRRLAMAVETRNVDLKGLRLPAPPHPIFLTRLSERFHGVSAAVLTAVAISVLTDTPTLSYVVVGLGVAVEAVAAAFFTRLFLKMRRTLARNELLAAVHARVVALRPEVVLYHSGDPDSSYQVNMWLSTVDRLSRRVLIVLRERSSLADLGPTTSPVVCIPGAVDFMTFPLPDVRVAMYTANVGKTIHLLREPGIQHVFIGHGDSDKSASSNPFSKVYSEVWVAGEGGRDRYRRASIGIHDDEIVEVGRPQLDTIEPGRAVGPDDDLTVLYAPTWEGWVNDPAHTSVMRTGPALVERLVALPKVRVVYKPHPFTGTVSQSAAAADARIRATIVRAAAVGGRHQVIEGPTPHLYDCFNLADVLVADISSVLSDFISSGKPYLVTNLTGMSEGEFRDAFPSAAAAYLLDPSASRAAAVLDMIRGEDPMAAERGRLKQYLLGPDEPDAMTRFAAAVDAAYGRAVAAWPVRPLLTVSTV